MINQDVIIINDNQDQILKSYEKLNSVLDMNRIDQIYCIGDIYLLVFDHLENDVKLLIQAKNTIEKFTEIGINIGNSIVSINNQINKINNLLNNTYNEMKEIYNSIEIFSDLVD